MSGDKVSANLEVQRNDASNTWIACVEFPDDHRVHFEHIDRYTAIENVKKLARHHANTTTTKPKDISDLRPIVQDRIARRDEAKFDAAAVQPIPDTIDTNTDGLGYEIDPNSNYTVAQHASHLQKIMTGLIEKAKREGLDGRLLAMANTDFERGFMALDKALTTNKG